MNTISSFVRTVVLALALSPICAGATYLSSGPLGVWYIFAGVIATPGTAVQLSSQSLANGLTCRALTTNANPLVFGTSSGVTNVTNPASGTLTGTVVVPGDKIALAVNNANLVWINGQTANDAATCEGN